MSKIKTVMLVFIWLCLTHAAYAKKHPHKHVKKTISTPAATLSVSQLNGFDNYPADVKKLITSALALAEKRLPYKFGSDDPRNNGMDCSGAISYLLKSERITNAPRQASELYQWAWEKGEFFAVNSHQVNSFEFSELRPGDLLFWTGTYPVRRDPAISHVMLYLGRDKQNRPLMFGATERRIARGKTVQGVGVFDFKMPAAHSKTRFLGYACIPSLTCDSA